MAAVQPLGERVEKHALMLHDESTFGAYTEMRQRWPDYIKAVADSPELAAQRRELFHYRRGQTKGKRDARGRQLSRRAILAYVDANLYLVWGTAQIESEEFAEEVMSRA